MQFGKAIFTSLALATSLAAATSIPTARGGKPPASECSTGPVQCCTDGGKASDSLFAPILKALGIEVAVDALVGTGCSALGVVGVGSGAECDGFAYCCEDNSHSLISISCLEVDLDL